MKREVDKDYLNIRHISYTKMFLAPELKKEVLGSVPEKFVENCSWFS